MKYYRSMCHLCTEEMGMCNVTNQKECYSQFKKAVEKLLRRREKEGTYGYNRL